jgi:chromosomal replication initiation ATPase DnaA
MTEKYKQISFHLENLVSRDNPPQVTMFEIIAKNKRKLKAIEAKGIALEAREKLKMETAEAEKGLIDRVVKTVTEDYCVKPEDLFSPSRKKDISHIRQVAWYVISASTDLSFVRIASFFGRTDHTAVVYGRNKVWSQMQQDPELKSRIESYLEKARDFAQSQNGHSYTNGLAY